MKVHELETLGSIACVAALELDTLRLGESVTFESVNWVRNWLTENISDGISDCEIPDPSLIVGLQKVLVTLGQLDPKEFDMDVLVKKIVIIRDMLLTVSTYPLTFARYRSDDLEVLQKFCLELSRHECWFAPHFQRRLAPALC